MILILSFPLFLSLRKTCHSVRDFLDDQNIDPNISELRVEFTPYSISVIIHSKKLANEKIDLAYRPTETGSNVIRFNENLPFQRTFPVKLFENTNFVDLFCHDFEVLSKNFKSIPSVYLVLKGCDFPEKFQEILKIRNFKTENLELKLINTNQLLSVLPHFDANSLKSLFIKDPESFPGSFRNLDLTLDLEKIVELDHWKNLEEAQMREFTLQDPLRLKDLKRGCAHFVGITKAEVKDLKEVFLHMPDFSYMVLHYSYLENEFYLEKICGREGFLKMGGYEPPRHLWYFEMPNSQNDVLCLKINQRAVIFEKVTWMDVDPGADVIRYQGRVPPRCPSPTFADFADFAKFAEALVAELKKSSLKID